MNDYINYIKKLLQKGGPDPSEYDTFNRCIDVVASQVRVGKISKEEIKVIQTAFGKTFCTETMQGFAYVKPHGYAGDFEIIHRIYQEWLSPDPQLVNGIIIFMPKGRPGCQNRNSILKI